MNQEVSMVRLILALYEDLKASCSAEAVGNWLVQIVHHIAGLSEIIMVEKRTK